MMKKILKMCDFTAIEMRNMWICSYCKKNQSCEQQAMKEIGGNIKICPDCYFDL